MSVAVAIPENLIDRFTDQCNEMGVVTTVGYSPEVLREKHRVVARNLGTLPVELFPRENVFRVLFEMIETPLDMIMYTSVDKRRLGLSTFKKNTRIFRKKLDFPPVLVTLLEKGMSEKQLKKKTEELRALGVEWIDKDNSSTADDELLQRYKETNKKDECNTYLSIRTIGKTLRFGVADEADDLTWFKEILSFDEVLTHLRAAK